MTWTSRAEAFARSLGLRFPLIQGPMAGGFTPPKLVAAVSNVGGLGSLGAAYLEPEEIARQGREIRSLTRQPFAINLFAPLEKAAPGDPAPMLAILAAHHAKLGLPPPAAPQRGLPDFEQQVEAVLESEPAVFSFTFAIPPAATLAKLKARGVRIVGTATRVEEARLLEEAGVDAIVVQGAEAGGHRGTFGASFEAGLVGTMALVPLVVDAVRVPVIAAGGIMDGRGVAAALALGASGVQLGTAFLTTQESGASPAHQAALLSSREDQTRITRAFSGRPARALVNAFSAELENHPALLPFPQQHLLTSPMRKAATAAGDREHIALWAGQGAPLAKASSAAELVERLVAETERAVMKFGSDEKSS